MGRKGQWMAVAAALAALAVPASASAAGLVGSPPLNKPGIAASWPDSVGYDSSRASIGASPSAVIEVANGTVARYSRTLGLAERAPLDQLTARPTSCLPDIQWDQAVQRWLYVAVRGCVRNADGDERLYYGWSKTARPTLSASDWCHFDLDTAGYHLDGPRLGHDDVHAIVGSDETAGAGLHASRIRAFDVPAPGPGCPAGDPPLAAVRTDTNPDPDGPRDMTPAPANIDTPSPVGYVLTDLDQGGPLTVDVWKVTGSGGAAPTIDLVGPVDLPDSSWVIAPVLPDPTAHFNWTVGFNQAVGAADPGAGGALALWTSAVVIDGGGRAQSQIGWYEILPDSLSLRQAGFVDLGRTTAATGTTSAISPTAPGDGAVLTYGVSTGSSWPDVRVISRQGGDPLGTMSGEKVLARSTTGPGDCSLCTIDTNLAPDPTGRNWVWGTGTRYVANKTSTHHWATQDFAVTDGSLRAGISGGQLVITADAGLTDNVSVSPRKGGYAVISDKDAGLVAGPGCKLLATGQVQCLIVDVKSAGVDLGDGNDAFSSTLPLPLEVFGGPGNDKIKTLNGVADLKIDGGEGNDRCDREANLDPQPVDCETVVEH